MAKAKAHGVDPERVASHALVVGDPRRASDAAGFLQDAALIWDEREYRIFSGNYKGKPITICSHGVGASGAATIFEVLFNAGVRVVIRAGTCGAMVRTVQDGGIIIGTGAIREDGLSQSMVPMEYPAISDRHVVRVLEEVSRELGHPDVCVGVVLTNGLFYPSPYVPYRIDMWQELGAVAIEMEFATLLIQAGMHGAKAGGIFVSDGNVVEEPDPWKVNPNREVVHQGKTSMIEIALEALSRLD